MKYVGILLSLFSISFAKEIPFSPSEVLITGRADYSDPSMATFDWPGTVIESRFTGTSIAANLSGICRYNCIIDGKEPSLIEVTSGAMNTYLLGSDLSEGEHTIRLEKRYETNWYTTSFGGFSIDDTANLLPLPPRPSQKIEFIGDSYSVGYGVESPSREGSSGAYEEFTNITKDYVMITANYFGAEPMVCAISGKGLVENLANSESGWNIPTLYEYVLQSRIHGGTLEKWDFSKFTPDLVVINLGGNDFSERTTSPEVDSATFVAAYRAFLGKIRARYPSTKFVLCANYDWPKNLKIPAVQAVIAEEKAAGNSDCFFYDFTRKGSSGWSGLDWHPNVEEQQGIADGLIALIEKEQLLSIETPIVPVNRTAESIGVSVENSTVIVHLTQSEPSLELTCYSIQGKEIDRVVAGPLSEGSHRFTIDAASGTYLLTLKMGDRQRMNTKISIREVD